VKRLAFVVALGLALLGESRYRYALAAAAPAIAPAAGLVFCNDLGSGILVHFRLSGSSWYNEPLSPKSCAVVTLPALEHTDVTLTGRTADGRTLPQTILDVVSGVQILHFTESDCASPERICTRERP
jgi:hypothetical protein